MYKKILFIVLGLILSVSLNYNISYGQSTTTKSIKNTVITPKQKAKPATMETTESTITTTSAIPRPAYDQATLKKMDDTLCVEGFDAKVGNDNKNVCSGIATAPDLAYSCIWAKKGESAYATTRQGPCNLDFSEHRGNIIITKADYKSSPPLSYGTKAECCFRAASGKPSTSTTSKISSSH